LQLINVGIFVGGQNIQHGSGSGGLNEQNFSTLASVAKPVPKTRVKGITNYPSCIESICM